MKIDNIEALNLGSFFLGGGGGFESSLGRFMLKDQLKKNGIEIISLDSLKPDDLVVAVSYMGCPTIEAEKTYNYSHFEKILEKITSIFQRKIDAFAMWSATGGAPFVPLFLSSRFNTPLLDADLTGRCFPELQVLSTNVAGIRPTKSFVSNLMGDTVEMECNSFLALERHARQTVISSGGLCFLVPQILTGEEAKRGLIPGTLTQAMTIGQIIQDTRDLDEKTAFNAIVDYTKGTFVGVGGIMTNEGCLGLPHPFKRRITIRNAEENKAWELLMDNEFNLLFENGEIIAEVPDIITLCNLYTREPLTFKQLRPNTNVGICIMKAPDIWYTEKGLNLTRTAEHIKGRECLFTLRGPLRHKTVLY